MELLAAHDQENRVHALQAGAAGKSLNAGLKGTARAPKTPFKAPLSDENSVFKAPKTTLKTGLKNENAFVTPGPRTRAPLGMKTTNAKARAFQTPGPLSASGKTLKASPRLRRPKVKVHQLEPEDEDADDVREVEYMPPRAVPLPDNIDDDMPPIDWTFPMLKGANMTRGSLSIYRNPIEADGRTRAERTAEEMLEREKKKASEDFDSLFADIMAKDDAEAKRYLGIEAPKKPAPSAELSKRSAIPRVPSTLRARSAAAALAPTTRPHYTAPTAAAKSRLPGGLLAGRKPVQPILNPSATRNAAASAASKSTIGYAQGRATGPPTRKPLSNISRPAPSSSLSKRPTIASSTHNRSASTSSAAARRPRAPLSRSSSTSTTATLVAVPQEHRRTAEDVEREAQLLLLQESDDEGTEAWMVSFRSQLQGDTVDEAYEDFQFELPEGI